MFIHVRSFRGRIRRMATVIALLPLALAVRLVAQNAETNEAQVVATYGKLPLRFEANRGQANKQVKFLARGGGYGLYLTGHDAVLALHKQNAGKTDVVRIQIEGSNTLTRPAGENRLAGIVNYIQSSDPASWKTDIPTYSKVRYANVYPGIDLVYYGNQQQLEYDFVVAPHRRAHTIQLHFAGAQSLKLDLQGNLIIYANDGSIAFHKPVVYQTIDSRRLEVPGRFTLLAGNSAGFEIGSYNHDRPLVIDPTLIYSTYLGGTIQDSITAMAVDSSGEAYVTGTTLSNGSAFPDFPTTPGAYNTAGSESPTSNAFVSKLNASGTALLYSTYLAPGATTSKIAIDSAGDAYVVGTTTSSSYPTTAGVYQPISKTPNGTGTGFITKLNPTGSSLLLSTFLGGSTSDSVTGLVLNSAGDMYVSGLTYSSNFPTSSGAYQTTNKSAPSYTNTFVTELNPTATALIFSTLLGGSDEYLGQAPALLAVDSSGNPYVVSTAASTDFPITANAYQTTNKNHNYSSITLSKFNPTGTQLLYSTFLGGSGNHYTVDQANGIAVDTSGDIYLAGVTYDATFPVTTGALQATDKSGGGTSASTGFVTKFNPAATALLYSTFLGGSTAAQQDGIYGLALDSSGDAFVSGQTQSTDYPVTSNAYQTTNPVNTFESPGSAPVLTELNPSGAALIYSTYFGGPVPSTSSAYTVALGPSGSVFIAGITAPSGGGTNLPVTSGAFQTSSTSQYGSTGFVAELSLGSAPTTLPTTTSLLSNGNPAVTGTNLTFTAFVAPNTGSAIPTGNVVFSIDNATVATVALNVKGSASYTTTSPLSLGQHYILASYAGNSTYSASAGSLTQNIAPAAPVIAPASGPYTSAKLVTIADATPGAVLYYTLDGTTPTASSTKYTAPFLVSTTTNVNAIAIISGDPSSRVETVEYSFLSAPTVLAVSASAIGTPNATLNALVNSGGVAGSYHFIYGTNSTALTSTTAATSFGGSVLSKLSIAPFQATAKLTNLATKTTYYFQIVVTTTAGTSSGQILSFATN